jgi:hypothetical protein
VSVAVTIGYFRPSLIFARKFGAYPSGVLDFLTKYRWLALTNVAATLSIRTFSLTALCIKHKGLISDIEHNDTQHNETLVIVLSVAIYLLVC